MKIQSWLLLIILAVGAVLRFRCFPHIPFTYDELSAWGRTGFPSFTQLIDGGVRGDGHPALIQVFLQYWRIIFGDSEAAFKLPFLSMGLASIWLIFLLGKKWFSESTGLLAAAFFAVLQYTVMYSQIARPYISGLFLSLLMVFCWSNFVFAGSGERKRGWLVGFIAFAVLCCYNHYFSLLFAFMVGYSGYFFLPRKEWKEYSAAGGIVLVLFLPHLSITEDQLKIGGVGGWLAKPDRYFLLTYLDYVFHFSWLMKGLALVLAAAGLAFMAADQKRQNSLRWLCMAWFILPMAIGFLYSKYRNPVLQYSVLIFSFPYLLFLIFSYYKELKPVFITAMVAIILGVGSYSLILERLHFRIFYKQPIEEMMKLSVKFTRDHPGNKSLILVQEPQKYMNYYLEKWKTDVQVQSFQQSGFQDYVPAVELLQAENPDYLICGNLPYPHLKLFMLQYPKIISVAKGFTYDYFVLAKDADTSTAINQWVSADTLQWSDPGKIWNSNMGGLRLDSSTKKLCHVMDSSQEFSPGIATHLDEITFNRDDYLLVSAEVDSVESNSKAMFVMSFEGEDTILFYQAKPLTAFVQNGKGLAVNAIRFRDFDFTSRNPMVKFYIHNPGRESVMIRSMMVQVMKGNPLVYSLFEPIPEQSE